LSEQNRNLYRNNLVLALVNGTKVTLTSSELQHHLDCGDDVEVISPT
jgi:hypothetical protein